MLLGQYQACYNCVKFNWPCLFEIRPNARGHKCRTCKKEWCSLGDTYGTMTAKEKIEMMRNLNQVKTEPVNEQNQVQNPVETVQSSQESESSDDESEEVMVIDKVLSHQEESNKEDIEMADEQDQDVETSAEASTGRSFAEAVVDNAMAKFYQQVFTFNNAEFPVDGDYDEEDSYWDNCSFTRQTICLMERQGYKRPRDGRGHSWKQLDEIKENYDKGMGWPHQ